MSLFSDEVPPMPETFPTLEPLGDGALLIRLGDGIDPVPHERVLALASALSGRRGITDCVPAYASLTVHYDPAVWRYAEMTALLASLPGDAGSAPAGRPPVEIPVCYGGEFGPDLGALARHAGLPEGEVIRRHAQAEYRVYFLGFTPGFAYLGGLDPVLAMPRRAEPRDRVPAGSVGIAGPQTGIYPQASPGGWQLIGRTPSRLFDAERPAPSLLRPGDRLRFLPIDAARFHHLERETGA